MDSTELWNRLRSRGVKLLPSVAFSRTCQQKNYIRLGFVGCLMERMEEGVRRIDREVALMLAENR